MSLNNNEIREAIEVLVSKGQNPTQAKVRAYLGRGSYTTINEVLRLWRKENNNTIDTKPIDAQEFLNLYTIGERDFKGVDLSKAILKAVDLSIVDLSQSILSNAVLDRVNLKGAILNQVNLSNASLKGADLTGADLRSS